MNLFLAFNNDIRTLFGLYLSISSHAPIDATSLAPNKGVTPGTQVVPKLYSITEFLRLVSLPRNSLKTGHMFDLRIRVCLNEQ